MFMVLTCRILNSSYLNIALRKVLFKEHKICVKDLTIHQALQIPIPCLSVFVNPKTLHIDHVIKKTAKILAIEQIKFKRLCLYSWCSRLCGPQYLISNDFMLMNESIGSHLKKTCIIVQNI